MSMCSYDAVLERLRRTQPRSCVSASETAAYLYITSCLMCPRALQMEELLDQSGSTDTSMRATVYAVLRRLAHSPSLVPSTHLRVGRCLQASEDTRCDVIHESMQRMVRKRIDHDQNGLPAYQAVVEFVVHYLLADSGATHVAPLLCAEVGTQHVSLYYEYVPHPLHTFFGSGAEPRGRTVMCGLLRGVQQLHARGICHRDLKGPNIHVRDDDTCLLLDVGSAGYGTTRTTVPVTTITHRSPEILLAEISDQTNPYDGFKLDIWSLGVLLAELYLGPHPFGHVPGWATAQDMLHQIRQQLPSVLARMCTRCTPSQLSVMQSCLDERPQHRPDIHVLVRAFATRGT